MNHGVFHAKTLMNPSIDPCPELCLVRGDIQRDWGVNQIFHWNDRVPTWWWCNGSRNRLCSNKQWKYRKRTWGCRSRRWTLSYRWVATWSECTMRESWWSGLGYSNSRRTPKLRISHYWWWRSCWFPVLIPDSLSILTPLSRWGLYVRGWWRKINLTSHLCRLSPWRSTSMTTRSTCTGCSNWCIISDAFRSLT